MDLLLLFLFEFPFVIGGGNVVVLEGIGREILAAPLRRTVAAEDGVLVDDEEEDDELLIKRCDGGECV